MVCVKVLYFAAARELIGVREEVLDLGPGEATTESFKSALEVKYPHAAQYIRGITLAVNLEYILGNDTRTLHENDEVALIPPISGG
ncbi:hypothetical protein ACHHYP_10924 [Achlya hypogyna]|uniref:Molybdopterin synthase sulfur carrier subunit n=1 Tax=Achlya hypogyna TaxID=1202772 RepID=A0A1V9YKA2_ACHHY|nr:hypothetical protein ACHHYP_10924 [Achlya hypogyna]